MLYVDKVFTYNCPCKGVYTLSLEDMCFGEDLIKCSKCSHILHIGFNINKIIAMYEEDVKSVYK